MLKFKLIEILDGFYHYEVYPEGKIEDKEIIIFNPSTMEVKKKTFSGYMESYLGHFLRVVTDPDGNYRESGMAAWY